MYEVGEQIVYGCQGVYEVNDITHLDIGQEDRLYYVLTPVILQWITKELRLVVF